MRSSDVSGFWSATDNTQPNMLTMNFSVDGKMWTNDAALDHPAAR